PPTVPRAPSGRPRSGRRERIARPDLRPGIARALAAAKSSIRRRSGRNAPGRERRSAAVGKKRLVAGRAALPARPAPRMGAPVPRPLPEPDVVTDSNGPAQSDPSQRRRRLSFIVASLLFIVAGATLGVTVIGHTFADDGKVNHAVARYGIQAIQGALI